MKLPLSKGFFAEAKVERIVPDPEAADQPHPQFLRWHRENCFKH